MLNIRECENVRLCFWVFRRIFDIRVFLPPDILNEACQHFFSHPKIKNKKKLGGHKILEPPKILLGASQNFQASPNLITFKHFGASPSSLKRKKKEINWLPDIFGASQNFIRSLHTFRSLPKFDSILTFWSLPKLLNAILRFGNNLNIFFLVGFKPGTYHSQIPVTQSYILTLSH